MNTLGTFFLHLEYEANATRGDLLSERKDLIDCERFRPRLSTLYEGERDQGGRPHTDVIVLMKLPVL
ncbi:hypothetical protein DSECCO2_342580 [anaerobic digester metagenome]